MNDTFLMSLACQPNKRAKQFGRLHPYWGAPSSQGDPFENQDSSPPTFAPTDGDENSETISTQERQSLLTSESCKSISNSSHQNQLPHSMNTKPLEIQELVHRFATLLNDSIRIAETAYSVCLLETQVGVLFQAQKIAKVRSNFDAIDTLNSTLTDFENRMQLHVLVQL